MMAELVFETYRQAALSTYDKIIEKANDLTIFPKRRWLVPDKKMA